MTHFNDRLFEKLSQHDGHNVHIAQYGRVGQEPQNVVVECEECGQVLVDVEKEKNAPKR